MPAPDSLQEIPFLRDLEAEDRNAVAAFATSRRYSRGETIFAEGATDDSLCVLAKGLVSFRVKQKDGVQDATMGTASDAGDVFGIAAVVGQDHVNPYSAVCLEDCEVLELEGSEFREFCTKRPAAGNRILTHLISTMARRLNGAREQLRSRVHPGIISHG